MPNRPRRTRPPTPLPPSIPRPNSGQRGYDALWQRLSTAILNSEPTCRACAVSGRITAAVLVDHIQPLADGGARLDRANLQPLCRPCHAIKTRRETASRQSRT